MNNRYVWIGNAVLVAAIIFISTSGIFSGKGFLSAQVQLNLPDYMITGITRYPGTPKVGESVTIKGSVRNVGTATATATSTTTATITGPNNYSTTLLSQTTGLLVPNTTESEIWNGVNAWVPTEVGAHTIRICADTVNTVTELFEHNNCRDAAITVAPATTSQTCGPNDPPSVTVLYPNGGEVFVVGQSITARWVSCNIPQNRILDIQLHIPAISLSHSLGTSLDDGQEILSLPNSTWFSLPHSFPYGLEYKLYITPDAGYGQLPLLPWASDSSDNLFTINAPTPDLCPNIAGIQTTLPPQHIVDTVTGNCIRPPEYMVRAVGYSTSGQAEAGKPITITGTVKNVGYTSATVSSTTSATITGPNSYTTTLAPQTTGALAQNATETETWTGTNAWTPPTAGTYTIKVCADSTNVITEIYEYQNCKTISVVVNPGPVAQCSATATPFGGGSGTSSDPYRICTCPQLQAIKNNPSLYFILSGNIDCSVTQTWNAGSGFQPILGFTGNFDGKNFSVSDLYINRPSEINVGLFGSTSGSVIKKVALNNLNILGSTSVGGLVGATDLQSTISDASVSGTVSGAEFVGGLVGFLKGQSTISGSHSSATITGDVVNTGGINGNIGGLVGHILQSTVSNSYATGNVTGYITIGGLAGYVFESTISDSYATGNVNGIDIDTGGLAALVTDNSTVSRSYATGSVSGGGIVGGLVGTLDEESTISDSYAKGPVNGNSNVGGLAGYALRQSTVSNSYATGSVNGIFSNSTGGLVGFTNVASCNQSYWDTQTSGRATSACGTGQTTAQMKTQSTFAGWDFANIWNINGTTNTGYPFLR